MSQVFSAQARVDSSAVVPPTTWVRVTGLLSGIVAEWRLRRAMMRVGELDGRMLGDIGLGRGGIESAVRYGRRRLSREVAADEAAAQPLMPASWTEWR